MANSVITFYASLRHIFGFCPCCEAIFRVSDCKLFQKKKPEIDWMDKLHREITRLEYLEGEVSEKIERAKEAAREAGRRDADKLIKKVDPTFRPLRLNPNDAKVIFHPVDFIVFNGMSSDRGFTPIKNLVLLDKKDRQGEHQKIQKSLERTVERENYEWLTLRVQENGTISEE